MKIFVVIPLYNEEKHITPLLKEVLKYKMPVAVVDDGSTDRSLKCVNQVLARAKNLYLLEHTVNLGKGAAMRTGADFAFSRGADAVIFMDSDGQHNPSELPKFVNILKGNKYPVVLGSRNLNYGVPFVRYAGNKVASLLAAFLFGVYVSDSICGFRAFKKSVYEKIKWESGGYGVETEFIARIGKNKISFSEIPVETIYHDNTKGVTILDAIGVLGQVLKWKLTL